LASPVLREPVEIDQKRHDETDLVKEMAAYHASQRYTDWLAAADAAKAAGKKPPPQPYTPEDIFKRWVPAGGWFRLRVEPLIPYALRGVVWYQGEADGSVDGGRRYRAQLPALIADWRRRWGDDSLPFVIVQLPYWKKTPSWSGVREAQLRAAELPHTGLVVTYDVGDPDDVHPVDKTRIGERAARWALANVHGRAIECSGPLATNFDFHTGTVAIWFDHADGLRGRDGGPILGFELAGADKLWHPAEAAVRGKTIEVTSKKVPEPVAVRYAWIADPEKSTLTNGAGLPASPFRSDDWPLQ
jgi:sialate O-acetylesterase